jgi:DNA-directed RNA polymerase specialized sigma24 family protein
MLALETQPDIDFGELAVRLASYGLRTFAEFGLGGQNAAVPGVGLSVEDFVWNVLSEFAEGRVTYEAERGDLVWLLARALRNDIIDALRKAAHSREEARSPLPRENKLGNEPSALDELPTPGTNIDAVLAEDSYRKRLLAAFAEEPELAEVVRAVLDLDLAKPREIAAALGISVADYHNRKKRLRRRLIEYHAVEVSQV